MMSLASRIRAVILSLLSDQAAHDSSEIKAALLKNGIVLPSGYGSMWSTIQRMKKKNEIFSPTPGQYQLVSSSPNPAVPAVTVHSYPQEELDALVPKLEEISRRLESTREETASFDWLANAHDAELLQRQLEKIQVFNQTIRSLEKLKSIRPIFVRTD